MARAPISGNTWVLRRLITVLEWPSAHLADISVCQSSATLSKVLPLITASALAWCLVSMGSMPSANIRLTSKRLRRALARPMTG